MIEAHGACAASFPRLLTIIAPRHPERGAGDRSTSRAPPASQRVLRSRGELPGRGDRHLCRRHDRRTRPDLPARADRVHGRLAGRARRPESDRAGQARRGHSARPACLEFRRNLCRARRSAHGAEEVADAGNVLPLRVGDLAEATPAQRERVAEAARDARSNASGGALERTLHRARTLSHADCGWRQRADRCVSRPSGGAKPASLRALLAPLALVYGAVAGAAHGAPARAPACR